MKRLAETRCALRDPGYWSGDTFGPKHREWNPEAQAKKNRSVVLRFRLLKLCILCTGETTNISPRLQPVEL